MFSVQHWLRSWLGAVRQQAITCEDVDQDHYRYIVSLGSTGITWKLYCEIRQSNMFFSGWCVSGRGTSMASHKNQLCDKDTVALFEKYVILDKQQSSFFMGQVVRITHNGQDFHRPVALNDPHAGNINLFLLGYDSAGEGSFVPGNDIVQCKLSDILATVVMWEWCAQNRSCWLKTHWETCQWHDYNEALA